MSDLPPLMNAEVDLDGVRVVLESPAMALPRFTWLSLLGVCGMVGAVGVYQSDQLPTALGVAVLAILFVIFGVRAQGPIGPEPIVLEVRRGSVSVDGRELSTWDVEKAWWDGTDDVATLIFERADTIERVVTVRRQTARRKGVTRRQREWIADLITRNIEPSTAAAIPEGIRRLRDTRHE